MFCLVVNVLSRRKITPKIPRCRCREAHIFFPEGSNSIVPHGCRRHHVLPLERSGEMRGGLEANFRVDIVHSEVARAMEAFSATIVEKTEEHIVIIEYDMHRFSSVFACHSFFHAVPMVCRYVCKITKLSSKTRQMLLDLYFFKATHRGLRHLNI